MVQNSATAIIGSALTERLILLLAFIQCPLVLGETPVKSSSSLKLHDSIRTSFPAAVSAA